MEKDTELSKNQVQYIPLLSAEISIKLVSQTNSREVVSPCYWNSGI